MPEPTSMLKVTDVARELNVDRRSVYELINSGALEAIKFAGKKNSAFRITRAALDAFIEASKVTAGAVAAQAVGQ